MSKSKVNPQQPAARELGDEELEKVSGGRSPLPELAEPKKPKRPVVGEEYQHALELARQQQEALRKELEQQRQASS